MFFGGILQSACLSTRVSVRLCVCTKYYFLSQRWWGGIKSHLVTALVWLVGDSPYGHVRNLPLGILTLDFLLQGQIVLLFTLNHTITTLTTPFEKIVGKGENAGNQHFLLFPQCFLTLPKTNFNFSVTFILPSANAFNLDQTRILSFGQYEMKESWICPKLNGLTDNKQLVTWLVEFFIWIVENFMGKGENAGYKFVLLFPHVSCFHAFFLESYSW